VTFSGDDSGTGNYLVRYAAFGDEHPVLTAGMPITGWQVDAANPKIFTADVGTRLFRQLAVGGKKARRANSAATAAKRPRLLRKAGGTFIVSRSDPYVTDLLANPALLAGAEIVIPASWNYYKLRIEKRAEAAGERYLNVKDGYGGIRDIEFTVQLLQLIFGARHPQLRTGNTLEALTSLEQIHVLAPEEHLAIREAYEFLRVVEHRLQILDERAVRCLPEDPVAVERLALRMPRVWHNDSAGEFVAEYRRRTGDVRAFHQRLFYDPFQDCALLTGGDAAGLSTSLGDLLLALDAEDARQRLRPYLVARGFSDPERTLPNEA
jgi:hypothetical protein